MEAPIVNDIKFYLGAAQSVAITVAFLFLVWKIPLLWASWLSHRKEIAQIEATREEKLQNSLTQERTAEREFRNASHQRVQEFVIMTYDRIYKSLEELKNASNKL